MLSWNAEPVVNTDRGNDRGYTLIEVIATVAIMGIILLPLTTAVLQAMKLVPASGSRTRVATDVERLTNALSDDIAQAETMTVQPAYTTAGNPVGSATNAITNNPSGGPATFAAATLRSTPCVNAAKELAVLSTTTWDAADDWTYQGDTVGYIPKNLYTHGRVWSFRQWAFKFTPLGGVVKVEVFRQNLTWDFTPVSPNTMISSGGYVDEPTPYLTGYCQPSDTNVVQVSATAPAAGANEEVQLIVQLRNTSSDPVTKTVIDAAARLS